MKVLAYRWPVALMFLFVLASVCAAQQMDRVVDWQPVASGSNANVTGLEIVGIRDETHVKMGKPFTADED